MSNQPAVDGNELKKLDCGHAESSRRIDWEVLQFQGVGQYGTPYHCAECGLPVPSPDPPWTFGDSLATALVGGAFILLFSVLGIVPHILLGLWVLLGMGALYISGKALAAVVSLGVRLVVKSTDGIRALLQT